MSHADRLPLTPAALQALTQRDLVNALAAMHPGGIEAQEAEGQQQLLHRNQLPLDCDVDRALLAAGGFRFGQPLDDLFIEATLPPGWEKRGSDHSLWSYLYDAQGRERASLFYKAAFYDRRARLRFTRYFHIRTLYLDPEGQETSDYPPAFQETVVWDATGQTVYTAGRCAGDVPFTHRERGELQCRAWLQEQYPDWGNPMAYWDQTPAIEKEC